MTHLENATASDSLRRRWLLVVPLLVIAASMFLVAAPAAHAAADPSLKLSHEPAGTVHFLSPGESALWPVGVTTQVQTLQSLVGELSASGPLTDVSDNGGSASVTVELASCRRPWQGFSCGDGRHQVVAPTSLSELTGPASALTDPDESIPSDVFLIIRVTMRPDAPQDLQGLSTEVGLSVTATGDNSAVTPTPPATPTAPATPIAAPAPAAPTGVLAYTGSRLAGSGLLAALAVGSGIALSAIAHRRRAART